MSTQQQFREIFRVQHSPTQQIVVDYDSRARNLMIMVNGVLKTRASGPAAVTDWFRLNSRANVEKWRAAYHFCGLTGRDFGAIAAPKAYPAPTMPRPRGMHPDAFAAYWRGFQDSGMAPMRIVQTCTGALGKRVAASAGTHDADGVLPNGEPFSVSVDLSVWKIRGVVRWDEAHIKWALYNLADEGFAIWYRHRGSFRQNLHLHGVYLGQHMKPASQRQAIDFLNRRDGLAGHNWESFWMPSPALDAKLTAMFLKSNPECKGKV